ncbi:MAG: hypothetical protein ABIR38_00520 [Chthoniobacterales bacterium]
MKIAIITVSLVCLSQAVLADDLASPTPTATPAIFLGRHGRVTAARREERRDERRSAVQAKAESRVKERADRVAKATAQAQARQAAREREQAQRVVAAQNRSQVRDEKPHLTSDLMTRMGFSEQQIATQKAREQSTSSESKESTEAKSPRP